MKLQEILCKKLSALELQLPEKARKQLKQLVLENFRTVIKEIRENSLAKQIYGPKLEKIDQSLTFDDAGFLQGAIPLIEKLVKEKEAPYREQLVQEGYRIVSEIVDRPLDQNFIEEYKERIEALELENEKPTTTMLKDERLATLKTKYFLWHAFGHGFAFFCEKELIKLISPKLKELKELLPAYELLSNLYRLTHFMHFAEPERPAEKRLAGRSLVLSVADQYEAKQEILETFGKIYYTNFLSFMHELGESAMRVLNPLLLNYTKTLEPEEIEELHLWMKAKEDLSYILGPVLFSEAKAWHRKRALKGKERLDYVQHLALPGKQK